MTAHRYDNQVHPDNVYGHTLDLLRRHAADRPADGIHVDLACGFGNIAEHVRDDLGLTYVGVDIDDEELGAVRGRGFEAHALDLTADDLISRLDAVVAGRTVVSVSFLDGLEHLTDGSTALLAVRHLVRDAPAVAVLSVPNVTHLDVATKALLGSWDYTESGLLDRTHYRLWSARGLSGALTSAGLAVVDEYDVEMERSDQAFPEGHVGLSRTTSMGAWLHAVRDRVEPHALTNQFVWALRATGPAVDEAPSTGDDATPFLSVVMRTQGRRPQELREALLCLAAQTVSDFEVLLIAHRVDAAGLEQVRALVEDQPTYLRERIRVLPLEEGGRSAPLNFGLREARGDYVSIFDDDDIVFAHWVEQLQQGAISRPGTVVRGVPLKQLATRATVGSHTGIRAVDAPLPMYSVRFSVPEHLSSGQSPPICFAFPRSLHTDLGLRFDESLNTAEDLDFLLSAVQLAGVTDLDLVVSIYHWWHDQESSLTAHSEDEWLADWERLLDRIHAQPYLLPAGATRQLIRDRVRLNELEDMFERDERLVLKENHIVNIEAMLAQERTRVADLSARLRSQRQRSRQLKRRVRKLRRRLAGEGAPRRGSIVRAVASRVRSPRRSD